MYIGQCALSPVIPIFLMATGIVVLIQMFKWVVENVLFIKSGKNMEQEQHKPPDVIACFQFFMFVAIIVMSIFGKYFWYMLLISI